MGSISSFGEKYRGVGMPITILIITLIIVIITIVIVTIIMIIITIIVTVIITIITIIVTISFPIIYPLVAEWGAPLYSSTSGTRRAMVCLKMGCPQIHSFIIIFPTAFGKKMPYTSIPSIFGRSYLSFTLCLFNVAMENHHF